MFASALGFIIASLIFSLVSMLVMFALMGSLMGSFGKQDTFVLQENSVLNLRLEGTVQERIAENDPFIELIGGVPSAMGLNDIIGAIRKAKNNDKIKGSTSIPGFLQHPTPHWPKYVRSWKISRRAESSSWPMPIPTPRAAITWPLSPTRLRSIHRECSTFTASHRFSSFTRMRWKDGVGIQLFKVGTYKSFAESFTQTEMSDANREQITSFINDIWNNMKNEMALPGNWTSPDRLYRQPVSDAQENRFPAGVKSG